MVRLQLRTSSLGAIGNIKEPASNPALPQAFKLKKPTTIPIIKPKIPKKAKTP